MKTEQVPLAPEPPFAPDPHLEERLALRTANRVRPLEPAEEGFPAARLPNGVYGFTYSPATETPLFARQAYHSFEVHRLHNGTDYVVGYVTAEEGKMFEAGADITVRLYPDAYGAATQLVTLPSAALQRSNAKTSREDGNPVEFRVSGSAGQ